MGSKTDAGLGVYDDRVDEAGTLTSPAPQRIDFGRYAVLFQDIAGSAERIRWQSAAGQFLDRLMPTVVVDGEDDSDRVIRELGISQLANPRDLGSAVSDPVLARQASVDDPFST